jgi:hypothetical protein
LGPRGSIAGVAFSPYLVSIPCAALPRKAWHFAYWVTALVAVYFLVVPDNRFDLRMPRYYFHYRDGSSIFEDSLGEVFADASLAMQHARKIARELARGGEPTNAAIVVVEGGQQLFEVALGAQGD